MATKAQRTARKRAAREKAAGIMGQVNKYLPVMSFFSTFLSAGDINSQADTTSKFKTLGNQLSGKLFGLNFFAGVPQYTPHINIGAINNPVTETGIVLTIAGIVGQKFKLPYTSKVKSAGMKIAIPSAIGAIIGGNPPKKGAAPLGSGMTSSPNAAGKTVV